MFSSLTFKTNYKKTEGRKIVKKKILSNKQNV